MAFTGKGFTGTVNDVEWSKMLGALADHGVVGTFAGNSMKCTKVAGSRTMRVDVDAVTGLGQVYAPGVLATLDTPTNAVAAGTSPTNNRYDICVARFTWATSTMSLVMKQGTSAANPVYPSLQQEPGNVFEVPLAAGRLATGDGEYINTLQFPIVDMRYWLQGGKFVQVEGLPKPNAKVGAFLSYPDSDELLVRSSTGWSTFRSHADTGWVSLGVNISGFGADAIYGRTVNGMTTLSFATNKTLNPVTNASFGGTLSSFLPDRAIMGDLQVSSPPGDARWQITGGGGYTIDRLTANVGASISGTLVFPAS